MPSNSFQVEAKDLIELADTGTSEETQFAHVESASETLRPTGYIDGLDILRGIAVISVVFFHNFKDVGYRGHGRVATLVVHLSELGHLGVYLFFILSGFLITSILLRQRDKPRYYRTFYTRRALRILPAYVLILAVLKAFGLVHWHYVLACMLFLANMARLVHSHTYEYGVLWTLAVEEQFYLLWPTVVRHAHRVRVLGAVALSGILIAPLLRFGLSFGSGIDTYSFTPTNMDPLLLGAGLAVLIEYGVIHRGNVQKIMRALWIAGGLLSIPLIVSDAFPYPHSRMFWIVWGIFYRYGPFCLFSAAVLLCVDQAQRKTPPHRGYVARMLLFFGYISYGLYLVHPLILNSYDRLFAGIYLGQSRENFGALVLRFLLGGGTSVLVAFLSRRYYEERFLRRKRSLAPEGAEPVQGGIPAGTRHFGRLSTAARWLPRLAVWGNTR